MTVRLSQVALAMLVSAGSALAQVAPEARLTGCYDVELPPSGAQQSAGPTLPPPLPARVRLTGVRAANEAGPNMVFIMREAPRIPATDFEEQTWMLDPAHASVRLAWSTPFDGYAIVVGLSSPDGQVGALRGALSYWSHDPKGSVENMAQVVLRRVACSAPVK